MTTMLFAIFLTIGAYLFGSIASAILVSRIFALDDPRDIGSGNPGATNVLRSGNPLAAALTLLGDLLKGFLPVTLALHFSASAPLVALVALAAFLGHLYPVYFRFKGGKGVATAVGIFLALSWKLFAVFAASWLLVAMISRYSSLAALLASFISLLASFFIFNTSDNMQIIGAIALMVAFLFHRHRSNIEKLQAGTESKIGKK